MTKTPRPERDRLAMLEDYQFIAEDVARLVAAADAKEAPRRAAGMLDAEANR